MTRLDLLEQCGVHPPGPQSRARCSSESQAHAAIVDEAEAIDSSALCRHRWRRWTRRPARNAQSPDAAHREPSTNAAGRGASDLSFAYPGRAAACSMRSTSRSRPASSSRSSARTAPARPRSRSTWSACCNPPRAVIADRRPRSRDDASGRNRARSRLRLPESRPSDFRRDGGGRGRVRSAQLRPR